MMRLGRPNVGRILRDRQSITDEQLKAALQYQAKSGGRMGEVLIRLGYCSDVEIARSLAEQLGVPFVDLDETPPQPACVYMIPGKVALDFGVVPVRMQGDRLLVVARDPNDIRVDAAVELAAGVRILVGVTTEMQLMRALKKYYDRDVWH
jgi:type IV pilus assembly protein PilB